MSVCACAMNYVMPLTTQLGHLLVDNLSDIFVLVGEAAFGCNLQVTPVIVLNVERIIVQGSQYALDVNK